MSQGGSQAAARPEPSNLSVSVAGAPVPDQATVTAVACPVPAHSKITGLPLGTTGRTARATPRTESAPPSSQLAVAATHDR